MALRIRDKANYDVVVPFFWYMAVYKVVDGQVSSNPIAYDIVIEPDLDEAAAQQGHIKPAGSDLDVWVNVDNASPPQLGDTYWLYVVWEPLSDPTYEPLRIQNPVKHLDHAKKEVVAARYYDIPAEAIERASEAGQS